MVKQIFLWTAPRCISTAFERSIMEIKDCKVFHEPFSRSYHFGPERQSPRYQNQTIQLNSSYKEMEKLITKEYDGIDYIFSKDMAYAIENHFEILLHKDLRNFQHTFLIRNPRKSIPSLYKASVNFELTGWTYFDKTEAGFKQMHDLYCFVKEKLDKNPIIINSDDLQANPARTMEKYCSETGLPFNESILHWEPTSNPDWNVWNGWHENALKSTGFEVRSRKSLAIFEDLNKYPSEVKESVAESMPHYFELQKNKICI
ncbi:uncharacterized protein LOC100213835 isoform X2 [Hydra vulgaris]|uniref:Uncharacterized protein LOC100213835 isoform X2 n=1 Tax=Hydra vulgaris TaxID=6087 RepID=A0ABM4C4N2_HYDVU